MMINKKIQNLILEIDSSSSQVLYHYNINKLDTIYTLRKQHELGIRQLNQDKLDQTGSIIYDKHPYIDHISLFLDPIPLGLVREHFTKNKVYQTNTFIYEHQINLAQLKTNLLYYKLVENPINNFMAENLWIDSDIIRPIYFGSRKILNIISGYSGSDYNKLCDIVSKFKGKTQQAFEDLVRSDRFTDTERSMYAPTVPHLFVYPVNGELMINKVEKKYFKD